MVDAGRSDAGGSVLVATDGTKPLGPVRARIDFDANGLISPRDRVDLSISATPLDPEELAFFSARYTVIVSDSGTSTAPFHPIKENLNESAFRSDVSSPVGSRYFMFLGAFFLHTMSRSMHIETHTARDAPLP